MRQWFRDVCHFVRNSFSFCSQSCWECSTWSYQCLDWYTVTAASLLKEKCTHGLRRFPIFYQHFFLTGFFRQSQSLLAHLGYYLKLQIITYHCMIHACLIGLYLQTWHHQIKSWLLQHVFCNCSRICPNTLCQGLRAASFTVSQQFAKRLPKIFNMTLACCILLPLMVHILLCGWCWIPENATGTKWSDNMPCLHKPSHFQLSVISLVVVLTPLIALHFAHWELVSAFTKLHGNGLKRFETIC